MSVTLGVPENSTGAGPHARCFVCGDRNPRSLGLRFERGADGGVRSAFTPGEEFQGYKGILHGGMVCTLLDAAMTHCLFQEGVQAVTGDLRVRFRGSAPCGEALQVRARLESARPPLYRLRGELLCADHLLATAEGRFMRRGGPGKCLPTAVDSGGVLS